MAVTSLPLLFLSFKSFGAAQDPGRIQDGRVSPLPCPFAGESPPTSPALFEVFSHFLSSPMNGRTRC